MEIKDVAEIRQMQFLRYLLHSTDKEWYNFPCMKKMFHWIQTEEYRMKKAASSFYLVCEEILPEAIKKTIRVKALLKRGDARTINDAVDKMNLSRSAYYKYKDYVFPFYEASKNKVITLTFLLDNEKGVLSSVLNMVSEHSGNVLTINQGIPLQGVANTTISIETDKLTVELEALLENLRALNGVRRLDILGQA